MKKLTKEQVRKILGKILGHYYCEDSWYSCPLAEGGCADEKQTGCTCGLEKKVDTIMELMSLT